MRYPIRYDNRCPDCNSKMVRRLAVIDGNTRGTVYYKCGAIANLYGIVVGGRGCVEHLKKITRRLTSELIQADVGY